MTSDEIENSFLEDWEAAQAVPIKWNSKGPEEMEQQGITMLDAYIRAVPEPVVPVAVEQEYRVPLVNLATGEMLENVGLVGIIDRVNPGNELVELKTSS